MAVNSDIREKAKKIRMLILDVDGVMTDGSIILDNEGNEYKKFHVRDGHGVRMLLRAGVRGAIISGRRSEVVARRARELGISEVHQGVLDKVKVYEQILRKYDYRDEEIAFMGDDVVDIEVLKKVGLSAAPADAEAEVLKWASYVSSYDGGRGAVRDVVNLILSSLNLLDQISGEMPD